MSAIFDPVSVRESLPSGTVTFAFTDIEGSTQRWERYRAAMGKAVRRHDALVRSAMTTSHGQVFKTVGDAFCVSFARREDAVAALLAAQRALAAEDFSAVDGLRVRGAIHTGTAEERDGDYFGPTVNRVARLLAIGHGGQVLVSGVMTDLVRGALPSQASLRDLGEHRLDDAETALAEAGALPNPSAALRLRLLDARAALSASRRNPAVAVRATERLLEEHRSLGNAGMVRTATLSLAEWNHAAGETGRAIELIRDVLPACRAAADRNVLAIVMTNFAGYLAAADRFSEASAVARDVLRELAPREPTAAYIATALEPLALGLALGGDLARAATLLGYADAAQRAQGYERGFTDTTTHDRLSALLAERLAPGDLAHLLADGVALSPNAAIALALEESS